jgi:ligand-binding SRPBCC domain-containing protein
MKIQLQVTVPGQVPCVFGRFDQKLFEALSPPLMPVEVVRFDGCEVGHEIHLKLPVGEWISLITARVVGESEAFFVDEGQKLPFPFVYWRHQHIVRGASGGVILIDAIEYKTKSPVLDILVRPVLWIMFKARHPVYRRYFQENA